MVFTPPHSTSVYTNLNLRIGNLQINKVTSIKYLGLTIDEKLDWKVHIQELCLALRKFVGIFYKLRQNLPQHILKMLYFALRILYGIENYANTYLSYLHDLMVLNNRILRI